MVKIKHSSFLFVLSGFLLGASARADLIAVGPDAFPAGAPVIDFSGLADETEVNGLTVNGVRFAYTVGGSPLNGTVQIDGGPGTTNQITPPNIVSVGDNTGVLTVTLPNAVNRFGYGFAVLSEDDIPDATTVSAFSGTTLVGALTFSGTADPVFTGGFAGMQSTTAFNRLELTFNSSEASAFAVDNITFASAVPEPSSLLLAVLGFGAVAVMLRNFGRT